MAVQVFISHSVAPWELALVNSVADVTARRGATPTIPDRAWDPAVHAVPTRIDAQIRASDYVIAIASMWGQHLPWLNQEVAHTRQLSPPKPTLIVADPQVGITSGFEYLPIDRKNPLATLARVSDEIQRLVQEEHAQALLKGLVIGGLALLFLKGR